METIPIPAAGRRALRFLAKADPDLARIEREAGPLPWRVRTPGFPCLLNTIVGQQISARAAAAIWGRLCALPDCQTPAGLLAIGDDALRAAGLSRPKILYARGLAEAFASGGLSEAALDAMGDEEAVSAISSLHGFGRWSAEIYLLFALGRPDVFPAADLGVQAATANLKKLARRPTPAELRGLAEPWQPCRAIAARLLWHWWHHCAATR